MNIGEGLVPGLTARYNIFRLVHFEVFSDVRYAIAREKEIKGWRGEKKIWLVKQSNPTWEDLAATRFTNDEERKVSRADSGSGKARQQIPSRKTIRDAKSAHPHPQKNAAGFGMTTGRSGGDPVKLVRELMTGDVEETEES
jgi:hypothetical protein